MDHGTGKDGQHEHGQPRRHEVAGPGSHVSRRDKHNGRAFLKIKDGKRPALKIEPDVIRRFAGGRQCLKHYGRPQNRPFLSRRGICTEWAEMAEKSLRGFPARQVILRYFPKGKG